MNAKSRSGPKRKGVGFSLCCSRTVLFLSHTRCLRCLQHRVMKPVETEWFWKRRSGSQTKEVPEKHCCLRNAHHHHPQCYRHHRPVRATALMRRRYFVDVGSILIHLLPHWFDLGHRSKVDNLQPS